MREIEDKFDIPPDYTVPGLADLPGCAGAVGPTAHRLAALYETRTGTASSSSDGW